MACLEVNKIQILEIHHQAAESLTHTNLHAVVDTDNFYSSIGQQTDIFCKEIEIAFLDFLEC